MTCKWAEEADRFLRAKLRGSAAHYYCNALIAHLRSGRSRRRNYRDTRNALREYRREIARWSRG